MIISSSKPLSLAEVQEYIKPNDEREHMKAVEGYIKEFRKLSAEKAQELTGELHKLNNVKIREDYIIKIIDFLPRDSEAVHKIFHDVSLDENETNAILEVVKNYKS